MLYIRSSQVYTTLWGKHSITKRASCTDSSYNDSLESRKSLEPLGNWNEPGTRPQICAVLTLESEVALAFCTLAH